MAQYYTDFGGYTTGGDPSNWDQEDCDLTVIEDASYTGGKALESDGNFTAGRVEWTDAGTASTQECVVNVESPSTTTGCWLRGSTVDGTTVGYYAVAENGIIIGHRESNATTTTLGSGGSYSSSDIWIRFQADSTSLKARVWDDGDTEPSTWDVEVTDSNFSSGWAGIRVSGGTDQWDEVGVGTNGDSAPTSPVSNPPNAPTDLTATLQ